MPEPAAAAAAPPPTRRKQEPIRQARNSASRLRTRPPVGSGIRPAASERATGSRNGESTPGRGERGRGRPRSRSSRGFWCDLKRVGWGMGGTERMRRELGMESLEAA
ncbi:hypothetical protein Zm00014a_025417 [Zea mays]|uniref:Uncharacterized protein n=1 Tax=Zea mays TaxID=4577 RepID=A0A317Y9D2_MAIZE|nr:hypothetical protein Zm00014a_025417 [Zea mays]